MMENIEKKVNQLNKIKIETIVEEEINNIINKKFKQEVNRISFIEEYTNEIEILKEELILKYKKEIKDKISELQMLDKKFFNISKSIV